MSRVRELGSARGKSRDWHRIVREQETSEVSVPAFCRVHGLATSTFYFWRRQLRVRASGRSGRASSRPRFIPVVLREDAAEVPSPQKPADLATAPLELVHPGGIVLRIPAGCDLETLQGVLRLLDERREARPC